MSPWPYPCWIAHRGAGALAPENTLAAFARGASHGYRMAECDVTLSADGEPFLLHDATLERTTDGHGPAVALPWSALARLDAGRWHSPGFAGEPLPRLADLARWCRDHGHAVNLEIKPAPGDERRTGQVVAEAAAGLWAGRAVPPLLTSFSPEALAAARDAAPALPRGLLLSRLPPHWVDRARALGCVAVVLHHPLWDAASAAAAGAAGLRRLAYTVNDEAEARRLLALGLDGLITDRVDALGPGPGRGPGVSAE